MAFKHGAETIELNNGPVTVIAVRSGVIGLVGISPKAAKNTIIRVSSQADVAQFGEEIPGFSIPQALNAIQAQGAALALVVNVFDPTTHVATVTAEVLPALTNRRTKTAFAHVGSTAFVLTSNDGVTTYTEGTQYTIDAFGNITILAAIGTIPEGTQLKATYKKLDATLITASVINGTNGGSNARTGFKCFLDAYNLFGYRPKILIAPGYSSVNAVAAQMIVEADYYKGVALIDAPTGTTVAQAITARGPAGTLNFNTSSDRAILLAPGNLKGYNKVTDAYENRPYSQYFAGVMANNDNVNGYWTSPSNKEIKSANAAEYPVTAAINDFTTEANALNEIGICTVFTSGSSGLRTWGNRSASYPSITHVKNFIANRRTADVIHESIELAMLQFADQTLTDGVIDAVRLSVQGFMNSLIGRGALYPGSEIKFDPSKNPSTQLAAGQAKWSIVFASPVPLELMTFESFVDISLIKVGQAAA